MISKNLIMRTTPDPSRKVETRAYALVEIFVAPDFAGWDIWTRGKELLIVRRHATQHSLADMSNCYRPEWSGAQGGSTALDLATSPGAEHDSPEERQILDKWVPRTGSARYKAMTAATIAAAMAILEMKKSPGLALRLCRNGM